MYALASSSHFHFFLVLSDHVAVILAMLILYDHDQQGIAPKLQF